ncbi:MAG: NfeD family protein [Burkholderiaceae bacterium]|nr:NfeD family protein [Burkholderiaceae bacterium]
MGIWVAWFVLAGVALVAELLTGTFYLLIIAAALAAGGVVSLLGGAFVLQLLAAAAVGVGGALALRRRRQARRAKDPAEALQHLDVGQTVHVAQWSEGGHARTTYRGALWDVVLADGERAQPGEFEIRAVEGNRLIVARRRA